MKRLNRINALKHIVADDGRTLYVRWSRGFAKDVKQVRSADYLTGDLHPGLSAVKISPEWAEDDSLLARRMTEYRFLRVKDERIGCHIYAGLQVGKDSDGYECICDIQHIATLSNRLIEQLLDIKNSG